MKEKILIKCTETFERGDVSVFNGQDLVETISNMDLKELAKQIKFKDSKIILFIASSEIVLKEITVPKGVGSSTLEKMFPNMLEDNIITNVENLHFSYHKINKTNYALAWLDKQLLTEWMSLLESYAIIPDSIYHLSAAMPGDRDTWQVWIEDDLATIKTSPTQGFTVEVPLLVKMICCFLDDADEKPKKIIFTSCNDVKDLISQLSMTSQFDDVSIESVQSKFILNNPQKQGVDLLHHYGTKPNNIKHYWIALHAAIVATMFLIFVFAQQLIYIQQYSEARKQINAQIATIYKELYPQAAQVISPKLRMQQELKKVEAQGPFFELLYQMGLILQQNNKVVLKSMSYNSGKMKITLEATDYAEVEAFSAQLKARGLQVEQNKTEQKQNKLNAEITISKGK